MTRPWVEDKTIGQVLRETAARFPERTAVVFPSFAFRATYAQLDAMVDEASRGLLALGLKRGEHLAVWATNWPQWLLVQFATARIGVVLVTINPAYRPEELAYVLKQSDAAALAIIDRFKHSDYPAMLRQACPEWPTSRKGKLMSPRFPKLRWIISLADTAPPGTVGWQELLDRGREVQRGALAQRETELAGSDPINIQYTSGTTGFPKAAVLTHRNLLLNAYYVGRCQGLSEVDRICMPAPFYHCFGCVLGTLCAAVYGAAMIVPAEYFDPSATLDAVEQERATAIYGVPTMFIAMLQDARFSQRKLNSLRTGIMGGSPCPVEVIKQVVDRMGAREITIAYGLTEASPVITQTLSTDPLQRRLHTVGRPIPGVEVKIVDPSSGAALGDNEQGELCARGHGVMLGYYKMPEATAEAIDGDGWLHSGDLAARAPDGYYRITGRIKDMVIRGGENIYPREIEEVLYTHAKIADAQVVGVPDAKFGEELAVWIKLREGATSTTEEVQQFCRDRLAHYKVPRYVEFVTDFPKTASGKVQKYKIRQRMAEKLAL